MSLFYPRVSNEWKDTVPKGDGNNEDIFEEFKVEDIPSIEHTEKTNQNR